MKIEASIPDRLFAEDGRINLYYLHETFRGIAQVVAGQFNRTLGEDIAISAGMWGGSFLVADEDGRARTNVVRLYSINSLPQNTALDKEDNFALLMELYQKVFRDTFGKFGLRLVEPKWGEAVPYSNQIRPTTTLQMWDASKRVKFVRAFFVWNQATWEESVIYDAIRNVRQLKENLNIDRRPGKKATDELKFLLQDVMITYYTLKPALTPDFAEHAAPIVEEILREFIAGLHDPDQIEELYHKVFNNALVYGYEEALEVPYKKDGLDIFNIEGWPTEKINWVPQSLKDSLVPYLRGTFARYKDHLQSQQ